MEYKLHRISAAGEVRLDYELSGSWLGQCLEDCINDLADGGFKHDLDMRFLKGAYRLAREALGTSHQWDEVAELYGAASSRLALCRSTASNLLRVAHILAKARFSHWTDIGREWVCVGEDLQMLHVPTGEVLNELQFQTLFGELNPHGEDDALLSFLLDLDAVEMVNEVIFKAGATPAFTGEPGQLVLCLPQGGLAS